MFVVVVVVIAFFSLIMTDKAVLKLLSKTFSDFHFDQSMKCLILVELIYIECKTLNRVQMDSIFINHSIVITGN